MAKKRSVEAEAAEMMRRLLMAVEAGDLDVPGEAGLQLVDHLQGALAALETVGAKGTSRA